uniref:interleukin-6 receptor subunit alpha n=1 Tax=Semicossyphus pulcher TaxID=241346 RepID=UPI0037E861DC
MQMFLPLLFVLCAEPVRSIFDGTCPRKEPPPGVLVLSAGSQLVLTCSGPVKVDGVKVRIVGNNSNTGTRWISPATANITNNTGVLLKSDTQTMKNAVSEGYHSNPTEEGLSTGEENRIITRADKGCTASPTAHVVQSSGGRGLSKGESKWEAEEMKGDFEEEEGEEGSRITRGIKSMYQWKLNGRTMGKGDRDWGEITFEGRGATLSLSSVRVTDSGKYACYYKGREKFSLRVTVADPPETPTLSCYKRSPSSKIRCEWTPQKAVTVTPDCFLFLSKSGSRDSEPFRRLKCSYSPRLSRCWCAVDYNEDELGTPHKAYLCVTSIVGNATSSLLHFRPMNILKPDPPSHVSVQQEVGQETRLKVTWSFPSSWKSQDSFYELIYELKYRPRKSSVHHEQVKMIKKKRFHTITDAMVGVEYMIQLRACEEYDGLWSDWSTPVNASSWTAPSVSPPITTMFPSYTDGSGDDDFTEVVEPVLIGPEMSYHIVWICGSFAIMAAILAVYIFRHKDGFVSKLQKLSVVTQSGHSPQPQTQPSAPTAPEVQALVTFTAPCYKEPPSGEVEEEGEEEENEEEQQVIDRVEALHFNNTSYFFLQK